MKKKCEFCGKEFEPSKFCSLHKYCSSECRYKDNEEKLKRYRKKYRKRPEVREKIRQWHKDNYTYIPAFGNVKKYKQRTNIYTNGATKEMRKLVPHIMNKVLEDCIKNPRKYLEDKE